MNKKLKKLIEENAAFQGVTWSFRKRLQVVDEFYAQYRLLSPYPQKPFVKSFNSFREYNAWKAKQKNPWNW